MVSDARRPPTNFINRNIQTFVPTRTSSTPSTISIEGVSVIFCNKGKIKKRKKINLEQPEHFTEIKPSIINKKPKKKNLAKIEKSYSGVRRTSIRSKEIPVRLTKQPEPKVDKVLLKREVLNLPVTQIPAPETHPFGLFLNLAKKSWKKYDWPGNRTCEALDKHPTSLERLLAAMEASIRQTQCGEDGLNRNEPIKIDSEIDNSYEQVYQRHVDTLNSVISQTASDGKRKRKGPPKLEIKIAPTDQYVDVVTQDIEDLNISDTVDNCGDLTPVITYNHVSTVSPLEEYGTISPGTSSKGSRSPSPLLEVPNLTGEISAKFPTA